MTKANRKLSGESTRDHRWEATATMLDEEHPHG
jgi:hypothetical protein